MIYKECIEFISRWGQRTVFWTLQGVQILSIWNNSDESSLPLVKYKLHFYSSKSSDDLTSTMKSDLILHTVFQYPRSFFECRVEKSSPGLFLKLEILRKSVIEMCFINLVWSPCYSKWDCMDMGNQSASILYGWSTNHPQTLQWSVPKTLLIQNG